jgi:hypothetical protein
MPFSASTHPPCQSRPSGSSKHRQHQVLSEQVCRARAIAPHPAPFESRTPGSCPTTAPGRRFARVAQAMRQHQECRCQQREQRRLSHYPTTGSARGTNSVGRASRFGRGLLRPTDASRLVSISAPRRFPTFAPGFSLAKTRRDQKTPRAIVLRVGQGDRAPISSAVRNPIR